MVFTFALTVSGASAIFLKDRKRTYLPGAFRLTVRFMQILHGEPRHGRTSVHEHNNS